MADSRRHRGVSGTIADPEQEAVASIAAADAEESAHSGLVPQLGMMTRALMASPVGKTLVWLLLGILLVVVATTYGQIRLNRWSKPFYDALSRRDFRDFLYQLAVFFFIASILLVLNVAQRWLGETLKLKLREGMVGDLIRLWMLPRRAFWLANAGPIGANPDQRMHEDARHLCELSGDLGIDSADSLQWRTVGAFQRFCVPYRGPDLFHPGLHGVGRRHLRGRRFAAELLGRRHAHQS